MAVLLNALIWSGKNTPLGRGKARRLLISAARQLTTGPIRTTYRGVPIIIHLDNITECKALFHAYDRTEMDFLHCYLTDQSAVFIDVGANSGLYTQWLASKMHPDAKIIAIEPNPQMYSRILDNVTLLPAKPQIIIEACAAGEYEGTSFLDLSCGAGQASLLGDGGLEVRVRPLAAIVADGGCDHISALKIDIEGYEDRALIPFFRDTPRSLWPQAIVIEFVHSTQWNEDVVNVLRSGGYVEVKRTRANLLMRIASY
jgi:FkbM family methyltransferase